MDCKQLSFFSYSYQLHLFVLNGRSHLVPGHWLDPARNRFLDICFHPTIAAWWCTNGRIRRRHIQEVIATFLLTMSYTGYLFWHAAKFAGFYYYSFVALLREDEVSNSFYSALVDQLYIHGPIINVHLKTNDNLLSQSHSKCSSTLRQELIIQILQYIFNRRTKITIRQQSNNNCSLTVQQNT